MRFIFGWGENRSAYSAVYTVTIVQATVTRDSRARQNYGFVWAAVVAAESYLAMGLLYLIF